MNDEELEGIVAHELAHVKNRDILISSVAATIAGAITFLATMARWGALFGGYGGNSERGRGGGNIVTLLLTAILAPIAATIVQMAISRSREYAADAARRADGGTTLRARQGAREARRLLEAHSDAGDPSDGAHVHRGPVLGWCAHERSSARTRPSQSGSAGCWVADV